MDVEAQLRAHIDVLCSEPRPPQSKGYFKTQDYLKSTLRSMGLEPREHDFSLSGLPKCTNIYAERFPHTSQPQILIGAHYESYHCSHLGADDNASAVAVTIEVTRMLMEKTQLPLLVVFFDMEEPYRLKVIQGSKAFAKFYTRPIERVIIMDLVGGSLTPSMEKSYFQFGGALPRIHSSALEFLHLPIMVLEPVGTISARSDYTAFRNKEIPFTFLSSGTPWYYHTRFDAPDILRFPKMKDLAVDLANTLSSAPSPSAPDGTLEDSQKFLAHLIGTPELTSPFLKKLQSANRHATRFEILRLYASLLPRLRKLGPRLWV